MLCSFSSVNFTIFTIYLIVCGTQGSSKAKSKTVLEGSCRQQMLWNTDYIPYCVIYVLWNKWNYFYIKTIFQSKPSGNYCEIWSFSLHKKIREINLQKSFSIPTLIQFWKWSVSKIIWLVFAYTVQSTVAWSISTLYTSIMLRCLQEVSDVSRRWHFF